MIMENSMIINSARYSNGYPIMNNTIDATIDNQKLVVPLDPANRHYQAILEWVADGNTITAAGG
tara:strand:+ start:74 stop:265 length:192 start_codon:yes stop_codon:yes gene_type:complete